MVEFNRGARRMVITSGTLVTVDEAAQELNVLPKTIHIWVERGYIHRMGHQKQAMGRPKLLIDISELRHFLANRNGIKLVENPP